MSKALNSINHEKLLFKLKHIGASPATVAWMLSYLSNHYQAKWNMGCLKEVFLVASLIFNIFINDLPSVPQDCLTPNYVDDSKLMISFCPNDQADVKTKINGDLQNQLLLNPDNTKLLLFGNRQILAKVDDFHVSLMGMQLTPSHAAKDQVEFFWTVI